MLLGWNLPSRPVDSGMPQEVGVVLARALVSIARVSFPASEIPFGVSRTWNNSHEDQALLLGSSGLTERAQALLKRTPSTVTLLTTRREETVIRLFEDAGYPWRLQGQIVLLSAPDAAPPDIDRQTLLSFIGDDWTKHAEQLRSIGIHCMLRPGVDGDIAGVLTLTKESKQALLDALAHQAQLAKFDWRLLSEKEFADSL
jgi:hypothetical protein